MSEIVFLLEEQSAAMMLEGVLSRVLYGGTRYRTITFEGKQDLHRQLERKIRGYQNPDAQFIVLRDQDNEDCRQAKQQLQEICTRTGRGNQAIVRIACREIESFYLADLAAVERGLGMTGIAKVQQKAKFRQPD